MVDKCITSTARVIFCTGQRTVFKCKSENIWKVIKYEKKQVNRSAGLGSASYRKASSNLFKRISKGVKERLHKANKNEQAVPKTRLTADYEMLDRERNQRAKKKKNKWAPFILIWAYHCGCCGHTWPRMTCSSQTECSAQLAQHRKREREWATLTWRQAAGRTILYQTPHSSDQPTTPDMCTEL